MYRSNPDPTATVTDNSRSVVPRNPSWLQRDNSLESRSGDESSSVELDVGPTLPAEVVVADPKHVQL
ncbi:hypothetical protein ALC57_01044 [Trachymyrmex cornetzi]|uniref:Uncharacterized protein n=1 Tax=Trachymyrmex cornetzi TaxID=471704 RepID=A0A151JQI0_9HYME|nr:hypothetical protein ALC57_01044 [Trachymyrmex cornetzi]